MEEKSWEREVTEATFWRNDAGEIMDERSWRRDSTGQITEEQYWRINY